MSPGTCSMRSSALAHLEYMQLRRTLFSPSRSQRPDLSRAARHAVLRKSACGCCTYAQAGRRCRKHRKGKNAYGTQNFRCFQISPLDTIVQQSVAIAVLFIEQRAVTTPPVQFCVRFALQETAPARTRHAHAHTTRTHTHAQMTRA
jgi:hypothetical protein